MRGLGTFAFAALAWIWVDAANAEPHGADSTGFAPQYKPTLAVRRTAGEITIDGRMEDAGWAGAAKATGFCEVQPGDQICPIVESEAWVAYDDENLYVALFAHDDPAEIRVSLRERDDIWRDDYFGLMLDPYGDSSSGYEFFVNPIGIQGDLRLIRGGEQEDMAFDAIWHSKGILTERGYQVEIAIPFSSLRFPDLPVQNWRATFWRDHQRDARRRFAWSAIDRDDPCWMCNWGTLTGIEGIRSERQVDVIANVIGSGSEQLRDVSVPDGARKREDPTAEASATLRYAISSNATAELTINPDFSQIESDATAIDVNQPFAIFYSERRPFFQEGTELYDSWISAVYTRSILNPDVAGKFTARYGRTGVGYTLARDADSPYLVPLAEFTEGGSVGHSVSQIARVRRSFGENSFLGALITDRRIEDGGAGTVGSIDAGLQFWKNYRLESQVAVSRTSEPELPEAIPGGEDIVFGRARHTAALDGETFTGEGIYASLERSATIWNSDFDYWEYAPTFRTDNGFTYQNDYRQANWWNGLDFRPNGTWIKEWGPRFGFGRRWFYDGRLQEEWIRPHANLQLRYDTNLFLEYWSGASRWNDKLYDGRRLATVDVSSSFSEMVGLNGTAVWGRDVYRTFGEDAVLGRVVNLSASGRFRPTSRLQISPGWEYARMRHPVTDATFYDGYVLRTRATLQVTPALSSRLVLEYDQFSDRLSIEPLVTYRWNAFTVLFLGYGGRMQKYGPGSPYPELFEAAEWRNTSHRFFAKFQYLLRV